MDNHTKVTLAMLQALGLANDKAARKIAYTALCEACEKIADRSWYGYRSGRPASTRPGQTVLTY